MKGISSAFSLYSFDEIPLPVRKVREKEEDKLAELIIEPKIEEGYFTRSRKKVKISDEGKEPQVIGENEYLNIDVKN